MPNITDLLGGLAEAAAHAEASSSGGGGMLPLGAAGSGMMLFGGGAGGGADAGDDVAMPPGFVPFLGGDLFGGAGPGPGTFVRMANGHLAAVGGAHGAHGEGSGGSQKQTKEQIEAAKREAEEKEKNLAKIYQSFDFEPLWAKLSEALTRLEDDPSAAQVLLPLIEVSVGQSPLESAPMAHNRDHLQSLMVVSKHVAVDDTAAAQQALRAGSMSPVAERPPEPRTQKEIMADHFFTFTEKHRKVLNTMVRQNPSLMSGSFSLMVKNPKALDFDNKRNYFTQQLHKGRREHYSTLTMAIRRSHIFDDSYRFFSRYRGAEIKHGKLNVRFHGEEGVDAGGVTREWFSVLARAMFNPDYALFAPCAADRTTYQPNRMSYINPDHLSFFKFVGRIIGKAIYDGRLLDAYFSRSFYKHILGKAVDYRDIEAVDPEYYKSLVWMLENDITDVMYLTFSVDAEDFGETKTIELKPGGKDIAVTEENKVEYVRLVTEQRLTKSIRKQIDAFLEGFHDIIPVDLIRIFSEQELELLISGLPDIDVDSWKNNTELHGYGSGDPVVQWFWRAVRSFDQTQKANLLQFITGTSKVPLEGFGHLQGVQGTQRFNIHKAYGSDRLPAAHTWCVPHSLSLCDAPAYFSPSFSPLLCSFNQLDLPAYESYEKLRHQLLTAMEMGGEGFGFA